MTKIYEEMSISLLSTLEKKDKNDKDNTIVIGISSSNENTNTAYLARKLLDFYEKTDYKTILINAVVDGSEQIIPAEIVESELTFTVSKEKITYSSGKELIAGLKEHYDIIIIAIDKLSSSIPALIFGSCCDGILLFETKGISNTLEIDKVLNSIKNINVKPLGFVLG